MRFFSIFIKSLEDKAKLETLYRLREMSDRQILDCGLSPDLVAEGVKAWPWRELPENLVPLNFDHVKWPEGPRNTEAKEMPELASSTPLQHDAA